MTYYALKYLILLKIQIIRSIKEFQWFTNFSIKNLLLTQEQERNSNSGSENQQLVEELHKPIVRELKKTKNIHPLRAKFGVDPADMLAITKCNKRIQFLLFSINIFSKYARVVLTKDKKGIAFQKA